jgi:hypothetical protein
MTVLAVVADVVWKWARDRKRGVSGEEVTPPASP